MKIVLKMHTFYNKSFIYFAAFALGLVFFNSGIGYAWSSPALITLDNANKTPLAEPPTTIEKSWITSLMTLGALISALPAQFCGDKIGRKPTFLLFSLGGIASHLLMIFATHVYQFYIARFLLGVLLGGSANISAFIVEIADKHNRGILMFMCTSMLSVGMLATICIGPYLSIRYISVCALVPLALFYTLFGLLVPESPYYYVMNDKKEQALESLRRFRGHHEVEKEFKEIVEVIESKQHMKHDRWKHFFSDKLNLKTLCFIVIIMTLGQFSGTTAVGAYLQTIFENTGSILSSDVSSIIVTVSQLCTSVIMFWVVEKINRKTLIISSAGAMFFCLILLAVFVYLKKADYNLDSVSWVPLFSFIVYSISFNIGLGGIIFLVGGELFEPQFKILGTGIAFCFMLFWSFMTALIFPSAVEAVGLAQVFIFFAVAALIEGLFVWRLIPETRGKTFMEIQNILRNNK